MSESVHLQSRGILLCEQGHHTGVKKKKGGGTQSTERKECIFF